MQYRLYGKTGERVSEIGLGGHQEGVEVGEGMARDARYFRSAQERARLVGHAIDSGVTYFDTTFSCEISSLGAALRLLKRREGLFISGMRVDFYQNLLHDGADPRTYARREIEARLRESGLDYLDQFMLGALDFSDPLRCGIPAMTEALDELSRLREQGKFRFLGFSCHDPDYAARLLEAFAGWDAVMTPYNPVNRVAEGRLALMLRQTGAAWIAMKTLVWHVYGIPVTVLRHLRPVPGRVALDPDAPIARLSLRFILQNPLITACVPAMNSLQAVDENVAASEQGPLNAEETHQLEAYAAAMLAEEGVPLAMGGLLEDNLRVRHYAIKLLTDRLGWTTEAIDWAADDAEQRAATVARGLLARLKDNPRWGVYLP